MRVTITPNWIKVSYQQQIVFEILYSCANHCGVFSELYELCVPRIDGLAKPRLSDILRILEKKGLVCRINPQGTWIVPNTVIAKLIDQAKPTPKPGTKKAKAKAGSK
jgi:hypothetical protein